jgi:hypothetical protein
MHEVCQSECIRGDVSLEFFERYAVKTVVRENKSIDVGDLAKVVHGEMQGPDLRIVSEERLSCEDHVGFGGILNVEHLELQCSVIYHLLQCFKTPLIITRTLHEDMSHGFIVVTAKLAFLVRKFLSCEE